MIDHRHLFERQAQPQKRHADRLKITPPALGGFDHGRVQPFFIHENHCQLFRVDFYRCWIRS